MEFSKRLTDNARDVLASAEVFARMTGTAYVGTEHLLLGILNQQTSVAARVLNSANVQIEQVKTALKLSQPTLSTPLIATKGFSETAKLTLRMSAELAGEFHQDYCGTEHILFSLLNQKSSRAATVLSDMKIDLDAILSELEGYLERQHEEFHEKEEELAKGRPERQTRGSFLNKFSHDLTAMAAADQLDPVVGRDKEIERLITILLRRTKNNPVLIGEAGVGKTAVVEGLAQKIAKQEVPNQLLKKKVLQLDLAAMVAGTKYRGEFEERLKRVLDEVKSNKDLLVFIDELHLLVGAGSAEGTMDAANILKPALARGNFRLIGATTLDEYRKSIEKDAALTRRLQTIIVEPPNARDTEKILQGLREQYENHHNVKLSDKVIAEAVRLSERYLPERQQPDKSLDVIDEAAARLQIKNRANNEVSEIKTMHDELKNLTEKMEEAVGKEDYERAALYKMRISRLNEKIAEADKSTTDKDKVTLKIDDVNRAVSVMTGVPLEQLQRTEATKLAKLEKHLSRKIVGQKRAVSVVSQAIRRGRAGIADGRRPIGSFIFLGPTGVGKTELAKVLAEEVFGRRENLIKIDMSEFGERHTASRLVGAPAGYIGYEDGGSLTEKIRRQPYSLVLFDEIEKAHPSIFNLLLQILEDGRLTDGHGHSVDFSNTVVILTSNIGAEQIAREKLGFGPGVKENSVATKKLRELMRPELLNRFDAIVTFDSLNHTEISEIFDLLIEDLNQRLAAKGIAVSVSLAAKRRLINRGYDLKFGARPLRRAIQDELENLIAEKLITRQISRGDVVRAKLEHNQIVLEKVREEAEKNPKRMAKT